jgi:hypothetical protein
MIELRYDSEHYLVIDFLIVFEWENYTVKIDTNQRLQTTLILLKLIMLDKSGSNMIIDELVDFLQFYGQVVFPLRNVYFL